MISGPGIQSAILEAFRTLPVRRALAVMGLTRSHVAICVALAFAVALLDAVMLLTLLPISKGALEGSFDFLWQWPVLRVLAPHVSPSVRSYTGTFVSLAVFAFANAVVKNLLHYSLHLYTGYLYGLYSGKLANFVFRRYLSFGKSYFDQRSVGKMASVLDYNHGFLNLLRSLLQLISETLILLAYVVVLVTISWRLTLIVLLVFPALHVVRKWISGRTSRPVQDSQARTLRIATRSYEVLRAIPLFQAFGREKDAGKEHAAIMEDLRKSDFGVWIYQGILARAEELSTLLALLSVLILAFALEQWRTPPAQIAAVFVFFFVARLTLPRLSRFHAVDLEFMQAMPKLREFFDVFNDDGKYILPGGVQVFVRLEHAIRFQDLTFAYPERTPVLRGVSFEIEKGKLTALVGPSGAGKTTLAALLMRQYDAPAGSILLDDTDIREFTTDSVRRAFALVSQDVILLDETLRYNLTFGTTADVPAAQLDSIVKAACLEDLIESLPAGLESRVGSGGVTLSGGQRQRVAIARALLRRAPILILDEATSALDSMTEQLVQRAIQNAVKDCTSLVIAHRMATIQRADRVVVLEGGRILEQGGLRELIERRGRFHEMWQSQKFD